MFVLFDRLFQGYLSTRELPRDYYDLNELETVLGGRRSGYAYKVADVIPVRVMAIDEARGRVDLTLAGSSEGEDLAKRGAGGSSSGQGGPRRTPGIPSGQGGRSRNANGTRTRAPRVGRPPQGRGRR
jgi:hypothetical protein